MPSNYGILLANSGQPLAYGNVIEVATVAAQSEITASAAVADLDAGRTAAALSGGAVGGRRRAHGGRISVAGY